MLVITTKPTSRANFTYLFYRRMNNSRQSLPETVYDLTGHVRT
jgi:hypothetical protein